MGANCALLRKVFDAKLFVEMSKKYEQIYGVNCENVMIAMLKEIENWQKFEINEQNERNEKKKEVNDEKHLIDESTDLVKCGGFNESILEEAHSKNYVKL